MKKNKSLYIGLIFLISLMSFFALPKKVEAANTGRVRVTIRLLNNGSAYANQQVTSFNYQTAYDKLTSGKYASDDLNGGAWEALKANYSDHSQENGVILPGNLAIHEGQTHNREEALKIIQYLFTSGNFQFLQLLNDSDIIGAGGGYLSNESPFQNFTDSAGRTTERFFEGPTIFAMGTSSSQFLGLNFLDSASANQQYTYDVDNLDSRFKVDLDDLSNSQKEGARQYTVDYGRELTYKIHINKELLTSGATLKILPNSSIQVDDISIPTDENDLLGSTINPNNYQLNLSTINDSNKQSAAVTIGGQLTKGSIYSYNGHLDPSDSDIVVTVHAHFNPSFAIQKTLSVSGSQADVDIPIDASLALNSSFTLTATLVAGSVTVNASSPNINSSGINFAMTDASGRNFAQGASFVLGKNLAGKKYIYTDQGWSEVAADNIPENAKIFEGGKRYMFSTDLSWNITPVFTRYAISADEISKVNSSLIQIVGLGKGDYFMLEKSPAQGYQLNKTEQDFKVFSRSEITPNGTSLVRNTVSFAQNAPFALNGKIPDYVANSFEYNSLSVSGNAARQNLFIPFTMVAILIAVIIIIGFIVIKVI